MTYLFFETVFFQTVYPALRIFYVSFASLLFLLSCHCHHDHWSSWQQPLFRLAEQFEEKLHVLRFESYQSWQYQDFESVRCWNSLEGIPNWLHLSFLLAPIVSQILQTILNVGGYSNYSMHTCPQLWGKHQSRQLRHCPPHGGNHQHQHGNHRHFHHHDELCQLCITTITTTTITITTITTTTIPGVPLPWRRGSPLVGQLRRPIRPTSTPRL